MKNTLLATICILPVISACSSSGGGSLAPTTVASGFASNSAVAAGLQSAQSGSVSAGTVGVVAYGSGTNTTTGQAIARSAIVGRPNVGTARTSGTARYNTNYEYDIIGSVTRSPTRINGIRATHTGSMTLNADFDRGTLTGSGTRLSVNGTISGANVGGTVSADPFDPRISTTTGTLQGQIGSTGVIGAFHGTGGNTTLAGGLVGTVVP